MIDATTADYAKPGDPGCGSGFEVCLTTKSALHYVQLMHYSEEVWAKCRK